ncbi:Dehydrogenase/reductase SDR family member 4 [Araneus ventricosus]|uniref:Dehydrogenase/reductase SDR family member 4 n=1 Tax=Araneus ventricosus TaxID=182803 RepID=A0A4Y2MIT0_ARAVE|nr:Dehydrogenase/reductase SDR family member 4 [Araneus ventricosus]GBN26409.1 Dehydrogenase/reductase SDR family member 4 [Araneus ventricosus]
MFRSVFNKLSSVNLLKSAQIRNMSQLKGKLSGKVAVVTASTEGIGFAIAKRLANDGASVVISSRKKDKVDKAVSEIKSISDNVSGIPCHVGKQEDRKLLLDFAVAKYGGIDILVSNAAVNPVMCQVLDTNEEAWDKIFDINVKAAFLLTQAAVPLLEKRGGGSIVYVSSIAAYKVMELLGAYSVSKTALLGLTKAVAAQCSSMNIRVNCLCPGIIDTKFSSAITSSDESLEMVKQTVPMRRVGNPDECAGIVSFLCSDDASYVTGESFVVAGGLYSRL